MAPHRKRIARATAIFLVSSLAIFAHAVLVRSTPKPNEILAGPAITLVLTFNSKVDQARSSLILERADHSTSRVTINLDPSSPEKLTGKVSSLIPGAYTLHWQVLAVDGHITRGQVPFQVK